MSDKKQEFENENENLNKTEDKIEINNEAIETEEGKQTKTEKYVLILAAVSIALLTIIAVIISKENKLISSYENKVYPASTINNLDVSNLEINDLKKQISQLDSNFKNVNIVVKTKDKQYSKSLKDLGYTSNYKEIEKEVFNFGKDKERKDQLEIIKSETKQQYYLDIDLNEEKLKEFVADISKETNIVPINPSIKIENEKINIYDGKEGQILDEKNLIDSIKSQLENHAIQTSSIQITANYKVAKPSFNKEYLQSIDTKISSYITSHNSSPGRTENLKNASSKINNKLLLPGEVFSYSDSIGPVSTANGYKNAPVIINGELAEGLGGGVCQVSSTLYNTQLKSGILPTQRRNHSLPVAYVPRGLDATVASGIIDYKFKNTLDYPIVIRAYATNSKVVVEFWSNSKATKGITYKPVSYVSGKTANTYLYGYDKDGKEVYKEYIDTSTYR